ncbi:MAG: hypothetical protein KDE68_03345 [Rhodocyclaceae bacterium]|nr:hypothetical protein [Rhodocyclaceae bacterium]
MDEPTGTLIDNWADTRAAWRELVSGAQSTLTICEVDLTALTPDAPAMHQTLRQALPRLRRDGLRILLLDAAHLIAHLPRTRALLNDYAHIASVRIAAQRDASAMARAVLIADDRHILTRPQHDRPRSMLNLNTPLNCRLNGAQLETIWDAAANANIGTVLGL